jgi:hypothetical protein
VDVSRQAWNGWKQQARQLFLDVNLRPLVA